MSQKDYNLKIMENLLRNDNHIRGLAKALKTNQTTISRKIKELEGYNVVDYRQEGRNKVYFLKNTVEAREYYYITEHYKLLQLLKMYPQLKRLTQKVKADLRIKLAVVFGSYAKGMAHKNSDIDMYIETESKNIKKDIEFINTKLSVKIGKYNKSNLLIKELEKDHVIIKGVELYYDKSKLFG